VKIIQTPWHLNSAGEGKGDCRRKEIGHRASKDPKLVRFYSSGRGQQPFPCGAESVGYTWLDI
jgi:hypothetical protein